MDVEYGLGAKIADEIEDLIFRLCRMHGLSANTPPHDMAGWIVKELNKEKKRNES